MIKPYYVFIKETRKADPNMFESLGGDYFKKFYEFQVKVEADYKRIKKAFATARLDQKVADLSNVEIDDTKKLLDAARLFGNTLTMIISNDYDAIYACPEVAAFMKLSPFYKHVNGIEPAGIYKFGCFGTETFRIDCYKVPNNVAEKDCVLLHKRTGEWLKLEAKISEYYERKYNAEREKAKNNLCFDHGIDFGKQSKSGSLEDFEDTQAVEICLTKENKVIRDAMQKVLNFMEEQSKACSNEDIDSIVAWDTLRDNFYEEFFSSGRYNDFGKEKK